MRMIDSDALKEILEKIPAADIKNTGGQAYVLVKLSQVFNVIDNQPTIERKKGKWIAKDERPKQEIYICSVCNGWAYSPWIGSRKSPKPNRCRYAYCPNCGADMRGDDHEDD